MVSIFFKKKIQTKKFILVSCSFKSAHLPFSFCVVDIFFHKMKGIGLFGIEDLGYFCELKEEQVLIGMDENVAMMVRRYGGAFHKVEEFVYQSQKCHFFC